MQAEQLLQKAIEEHGENKKILERFGKRKITINNVRICKNIFFDEFYHYNSKRRIVKERVIFLAEVQKVNDTS